MRAIVRLFALSATVVVVGAVCLVAGCAKKVGRGAVPETHGTLSERPNAPSVSHDAHIDTFIDTRDGQKYRVIAIGGRTWMAENLNYNVVDGAGSWCYENSLDSCAKYGRLYDWNTAKTVCPTGWHLPSRAEWDVLSDLVGDSKQVNWTSGSDTGYYWPGAGTKQKSTSGWYNNGNGTDYHGFSALPGGYRRYSNGHFGHAGDYGYWWTATEHDSDIAYFRDMSYNYDYLNEYGNSKGYGFSVRCVRDKRTTDASSQKSVGDDKATIEMVFVKGGTFMMGCTSEQGSDCGKHEKPAHSVTVSDFYIGKYEVTQGLWKAVMGCGNDPSYFMGNDNLPVERVSWYEVQTFIQALNNKTGKKYRLPTEAEWEYAARGGASSNNYKYSGSNNINDVAWYWGNVPSQKYGTSGYGTQPVGTKDANELGIYDMSGNVWEWVNDLYGQYSYSQDPINNPTGRESGFSHVIRGGSWKFGAGNSRVSIRDSNGGPSIGGYYIGFRLALSP